MSMCRRKFVTPRKLVILALCSDTVQAIVQANVLFSQPQHGTAGVFYRHFLLLANSFSLYRFLFFSSFCLSYLLFSFLFFLLLVKR